MAVQQSSPHVYLGRRALLVGPSGDVELLDLTGLDPVVLREAIGRRAAGRPFGARVTTADAVATAITAGVSMLYVDPALAVEEVVVAAVSTGVTVVVAGEPGVARRAGLSLLALQGGLANEPQSETRVVPGTVAIEVAVGPTSPIVTRAWVAESMAEGLAVGAVLAPFGDSTEESVGAEIALLTHLLSAGVCLIRGADPVRFRRVRTVVEALALAGARS